MSKGSLLDYRLIEEHVKKLMDEKKLEKSKAFIELVLASRLQLDDFEVEDSIIDGSHDSGIDAIYIDDNDGDRPVVYLFQSKYYQSEGKYDRSFEGNALDKMRTAINDLILDIPDDDAPYLNQKLKDKLNDISKLRNPYFRIVFISNSNHPDPRAIEKFTEYLDRASNGQDFFETEYLHLAELSKLLAPQKSKIINAEMKLDGTYMTVDTGIARTLIGRVSGLELAKLRGEYGFELFDKNVRGYLSRSNPVNKQIIQSATSSDAYRFFFLNNGLTIVCSKYKYAPVKEGPLMELTDLQIVNGGQTTNSLFEAYQKGILKDDVNVLVRIIETTDEELLGKITESTNTQTLVNARDLRSNDLIQKKIESHMLQKGFYYEARTNKYKGEQPVEKRIDAIKAAQAYYAYNYCKPADAKNKRRNLFGTLYPEIFNDALDINVMLNSYLLFKEINRSTQRYKEEFSFASYSEFHTLAMMKMLGVEDVSDKERVAEAIALALSTTKQVVEEEIRDKGDSYSHRAFFIDPNTLGRIEQVLEEKERI